MSNPIENLSVIEMLKPQDLHCNIFSVYDYDGYSMQELLCSFFEKINECINVSNATFKLAEWLVSVGLKQEVAIMLEKWLADGTLADIIKEEVLADFNNRIKNLESKFHVISVKDYGAKGDGVTDDTEAFVNCFNYCTTNNKVMFIPNGTYILNQQLKLSNNPITDPKSDIPIRITGESFRGVIINTTNETRPLIDASRSKNVYMVNLFSENSWFHVVQYGDDFRDFARVRDVYINNVGSLSTTGSYPSWDLFINTPSPNSYNESMKDSIYNRYPMEIVNNSGFNAMMINNLSNKNNDGSPGYPPDNSAIGIIDEVTNSTGVILIDCNTRSNYQVKNSNAEVASGNRQHVVYEIDQLGHIAIGCSTQNSDPNAPGVHDFKIRDNYPSIAMYDVHRRNRKMEYGQADDFTYLNVYDEGGTLSGGFEIDYKKKLMRPKNCDFVTGTKLDINDSNFASFLESGWRNIIKFSNISTPRTLEGLNGGTEGQILTIHSTNDNVTIKHDAGWAQGIRLKNETNLQLRPNMCVMLQRLDDGWYQI